MSDKLPTSRWRTRHIGARAVLALLALLPIDVQARYSHNNFGPELLPLSSVFGSILVGFFVFRRKPVPIRVLASAGLAGLALCILPVPWWMPLFAPPLMFLILMSGEWDKIVHGGRTPKVARRNDGESRNSASLSDTHQAATSKPTGRWQTILRVLRHSLITPWRARSWYPDTLQTAIHDHIAASERGHLGEIVVALETRWSTDDIRRDMTSTQHARNRFSELGVWNTELNNGVLIHVTLAENAIDLIADRGIAERVDVSAWQAIADDLAVQCKHGAIQSGLLAAIDRVGELLCEHFPASGEELNPDERSNAPVLT